MSLFLLVFFVLYSAMHTYLLIKARDAFGLGLAVVIPLAAFMLLMVGGPVIIRMSERAGMEGLAFLTASVAYPWMAFLFIFFSASVVIDLARLILSLVSTIAGWDGFVMAATRKLGFCVAVGAAVFVISWGMVEAGRVGHERLVIKTDRLPEGVKELRIVQVSDLHLGLTVREGWLREVAAEVERLKPDLLVSTGDLLDGDADSTRLSAALFRKIVPRYGKFAITGNHEFYAGIGAFTRFAGEAGFRLLRGEGVSVDGVINVAGIDDPTGRPYHLSRDVDEATLLKSLGPDRFTLLLKHRPIVDPGASGLFDLQLSGHTHRGQIFPFNYVVRIFFPYLAGRFDLTPRSTLYVSRGTGTWGPPVRFLAPPEITLIVVSSDKEKNQP